MSIQQRIGCAGFATAQVAARDPLKLSGQKFVAFCRSAINLQKMERLGILTH